jgi:hypothetical protein
MTQTDDNTSETLCAEHLANGWSVVDPDGGRWWPDTDTAAEIATADDPAAAAVRICTETPTRGQWRD